MHRRLIAAALIAVSLCCSLARAATKNVVVVVADDLSFDVGCYGNRVIKTPHLDRLAADATLFTHAFCTTASCSPSRSVLLSGMHNHANGMYGLEHATHHFSSFNKVNSLSARLAKAGYRTARVGKFHVAPLEVYPFGEVIAGDGRNGVEMAERSRAFIAADDQRPFFLYYCTTDPHRSGKTGPGPYQPNLFGNDQPHPGVAEMRYDPQDVIVPPFLPDTPTCRAELAEYYQSVSRFDQGVGRLIDILKAAGHWDDTLLIMVSDNGIPFPGAKTTTYDAGLQLPCIVRNPQTKSRGVRTNAMISFVDIAPTILDFAGVKASGPNLHGRSFLSILDQEKPAGWNEIYGSHTFHEVTMYYPMRVVRNRQHKLIWNLAHELPFPFASDLWESATWQEALRKGPDSLYGKRTVRAYVERPAFELYDVETDPDEIYNLADDPQHAATLAELKAKIKSFQQRTADPWLLKWDRE